jgi:hypothetical protein
VAEDRIEVHGSFSVAAGISGVAHALRSGYPEARIRVLDLGSEVGPTLSFKWGQVFFHAVFMNEAQGFLLGGLVPGPIDETVEIVRRLSACLAAAGLEHEFRVPAEPSPAAARFAHPPADVSNPL